MKLRRFASHVTSAAALTACLAAAVPAQAAAPYPNMPIRVIVSSASGGPSDLCMRAIAPAMQARLGQPMIVENITGATGNIGLGRVGSASPDGYTVAMTSSQATSNLMTRPGTSYDIVGKLKPVGKICNAALTLVVSPTLGVKSVDDLVKYGKANPGKLSYGSIGLGSGNHLIGEMFSAMTGITMQHIPFRGEAPAAMEIKAGRVQLMFMGGAKPFVDGHLVNAIATTNKDSWAPMPTLPAIGKTSAMPGFSFNGWNGLMVPAGTPDAIVQRLSKALVDTLKDEKVKAIILSLGNVPAEGTPQELTAQIKSDQALFKQIITERHLSFPD